MHLDCGALPARRQIRTVLKQAPELPCHGTSTTPQDHNRCQHPFNFNAPQVPPLRRALMEAAEKLHAVAAVREVETKAAAAAQARPNAESATWLLDAAIRRAGTACTPQVGLTCAAAAQRLSLASGCRTAVADAAPASRTA